MRRWFATLALIYMTGCIDENPVELVCEEGLPVHVDGESACVYGSDQAIIENGFRCPDEASHRIERDGIVICAESADAPVELIEQAARERGFDDDEPPDQPDDPRGDDPWPEEEPEPAVDVGLVEPDPDGGRPPPDVDGAPPEGEGGDIRQPWLSDDCYPRQTCLREACTDGPSEACDFCFEGMRPETRAIADAVVACIAGLVCESDDIIEMEACNRICRAELHACELDHNSYFSFEEGSGCAQPQFCQRPLRCVPRRPSEPGGVCTPPRDGARGEPCDGAGDPAVDTCGEGLACLDLGLGDPPICTALCASPVQCDWGERCGPFPGRPSTGEGLCAPAGLPTFDNAGAPDACVPGGAPCPDGQACQPTRGEFVGFSCQPAGPRATGSPCDGAAQQCGAGDLCTYRDGAIGRWGTERVPMYRIEWYRDPAQPGQCRRLCGLDLPPCGEGQECGRLRDPSQRDTIFPRMGVCRDSPVP